MKTQNSRKKKKNGIGVFSDNRSPLEVAVAIGERFMKIPPDQEYMYHFGMQGVLDLYEATKEQRYLDFYTAFYKKGFNWRLFLITGDRRWAQGMEEAGEKFLTDPRRDREGAMLDPRGRYTVDVFAGQSMMLIIFGHLLRDHRYFDETVKLFKIVQSYLEDPQTGVWYSRWGHSLHPNRSNPGLWSRGNGWLVDAWGRVMPLWDKSHPGYGEILPHWQRYCRSIAALQRPSGLFRQLLIRPNSFEEASGSGLFCSGFSRGVRDGNLPVELGAVAYRAFCGLRGLVDDKGNIHNASTFAGGYNFERQYESCARFNEPHGDGTVMGGCVALHLLLKDKPKIDTTPPVEKPRIITIAAPGVLTTEPPPMRFAADIAPPVLKRALALKNIPPHDPCGNTVLGLLHWSDYAKDKTFLSHARTLLERDLKRLPPMVQWNLLGEISLRTGEKETLMGLRTFVDEELARASRDRAGVFMDRFGGYSIEHLYGWLMLLAKAGAASGENRYFDEACVQLLGHQRWLEDPLMFFWYSAFGRGAHPRRVTPGLWGLGNAYVLTGIVSLLEHLPRNHKYYVDVICLLRRFANSLHEYLPVGSGGWRQVLDNLQSFPCNAGSALLTYGCSVAILNGWVEPQYYAAVWGGVYHIGAATDKAGNFLFSTLPHGGLDAVEAYEQHRLQNDPAALGFILSGLAYGAKCMKSGINPDERDKNLGAR